MQITIDFLQSNTMDSHDFVRLVGNLESGMKSLEKSIEELNKRLSPIEQMVKEHEALRNKGFGVMAALGVAGGAIAYICDILFKKFF